MTAAPVATKDEAATAPRLLYRFRSLKRLLDDGELRNQEIYFAHPSQLNDPMEGFLDLFWDGDRILWENLFRHYLRCLHFAMGLMSIFPPEQRFGWTELRPLANAAEERPEAERSREALAATFEAFLTEPAVALLVDRLSRRSHPVRRDELRGYFRALHPLAIALVLRAQQNVGLSPANPQAEDLLRLAGGKLAAFQGSVEHADAALARGTPAEVLDELFAISDHMAAQMGLVSLLQADAPHDDGNRDFVFRYFPEEFVDELERLVYPSWRAACFLSNPLNSSLWGGYGDSHKGVCLVFKPDVSDSGVASLALRRVNGWSSNVNDKVGRPTLGEARHEFRPVRYVNAHPQVDFFRSLGVLPEPVVHRNWLCDPQGNRSSRAGAFDELWRQSYWRDFDQGITTKMEDWRGEGEHRLLLSSSLFDHSRPDFAKATYDFASLHGVVFGMKTPLKERLAVCKIIEAKCVAAGRTDFKFYDAHYKPGRGIEHREMSLIRIAP